MNAKLLCASSKPNHTICTVVSSCHRLWRVLLKMKHVAPNGKITSICNFRQIVVRMPNCESFAADSRRAKIPAIVMGRIKLSDPKIDRRAIRKYAFSAEDGNHFCRSLIVYKQATTYALNAYLKYKIIKYIIIKVRNQCEN